MRIFMTGGTGFVGRYVAAHAVAQGHEVVLLVRSATDPAFLEALLETGRVEIVRGDLSRSEALVGPLTGCDAIIHLAAVKGGDYFSRFSGTVVGTETLLQAAGEAGVKTLTAISTFSVYDYDAIEARSALDESSPVISDVAEVGEYAETKLYQEELYWKFGAEETNRMVMVRPGMIYGRGELWHPLLGGEMGPVNLRVGGKIRPPITYVEHAAEAIVAATIELVEHPEELNGQIINIVDDNLPTQDFYVGSLERLASEQQRAEFPGGPRVPYRLMRGGASMLGTINHRYLGGRMKVPSLAVSKQLDARFKSFTYPNSKAKRILGWQPRFSLEDSLIRSLGEADLLRSIVASGDGKEY